MQQTIKTIALDAALVGAACAGANWLERNANRGRYWVWVEVVIGVGACMAHATALGTLVGGDWQGHTWRVARSFVIAGVPIILEEVQRVERRGGVLDYA